MNISKKDQVDGTAADKRFPTTATSNNNDNTSIIPVEDGSFDDRSKVIGTYVFRSLNTWYQVCRAAAVHLLLLSQFRALKHHQVFWCGPRVAVPVLRQEIPGSINR